MWGSRSSLCFAIAGLLVLALVLALALPSLALATECLVFAIAALGGNFLLGRVGLLSFGQAAFFGLASYGTGLLMLHTAVGGSAAILGGVLVAGVAGLLVGAIAVLRRGVYFIMLTLALGQMFFFVAYAASELTGGDNGLQNVPRSPLSVAGFVLASLDAPWRMYLLAVVCLIACYFLLHCIARSPFGAVLEAIRENEDRAIALGYNTRAYKLVAFVVSALIAGVAGALYALFLRFVPLSNIDFSMNERLLIMTILGGTGSLFGGVLGGIGFTLLASLLSSFWAHWMLILGAVLLLVSVWMRGGLWSAVERLIHAMTGRQQVSPRGHHGDRHES